MMQKGHLLWDETISFAQNCSWRAGPVLAERMKENAFNDWERVCVAVEDGCIAGYCTFTGKDELADQYDYYAVPSFFDGKKKLFEAHLFMSYENIRDEIGRVLDYALTETSVGSKA